MHRPQDDVVPLHEPFETALRGFNRQQVLAHIESLEGHISMVTADRESALRQVAELSSAVDDLRTASDLLSYLRQETEKINKRRDSMTHEPIIGASERIERIVTLAKEEATELRAQAEREAADLRTRTEKECQDLRERTEQELTAQRKRAASEAEALLRDTAARCKQLEANSEQRRKAAEQAAEQDIARRESEANGRIQSREQRGLAALQLILTIVAGQWSRRVSQVEAQEAHLAELRARTRREVNALETVRAKITAQLASTRQSLTEALDQVQRTTIGAEADAAHSVPAQRDGSQSGERENRNAPANQDAPATQGAPVPGQFPARSAGQSGQ